ncbi:MAG: LysM peptidoglycan-binding domain-containing protein [Myxococcota bacterium]
MFRPIAAALLILLMASTALAEKLPTPPSLVPAVRFWTRIYTEVDTNSGLIHDSVNLGVVYETVRFPEGISYRARERRNEKTKKKIRAALLALAKGKRTGLTSMQSRVLAQWPKNVSNATLRKAADQVRFQLGLSNRFRAGLERSGIWRSHIEKALDRHGVPEELVALPHVESSYNPKAYSSVGAAGMWQFTRSTGRLFMRIDSVVDERLDPYIATESAARLLKKNYQITGAWPLAITAYNHGAAGMRRASKKLGTKDMGEIVRRYKSRTFGFASRNFYASFQAASNVDKDPTRHFGKVQFQSPRQYTEIKLPWFTPASELARALGIDTRVLKESNPALRPAVWNGNKHIPANFTLKVPQGTLHQSTDVLIAKVPAQARHSQQHRDRYHKVRRGETLSRIAKRYGVRERELVAINNLRSRHRIRVGQVLVLPGGSGGSVSVAREPVPASGQYRVRRGDTLSIIAKRFGVSERALQRENGIRNRNRIAVGQRLRIPGATTVVASAKPAPAPAAPKPPAPEAKPAAAKPSPKPAPSAPAETAKPAETAAAPVPEPKPEVAPPAEPTPPPTPAAEPATEPAPESKPEPPPAAVGDPSTRPDPSDYAVHGNRIRVQAAETLGHYADWLEVRASRLRQLNRMRFEQPVVIGQRLRLDFARVTPQEFERRRLEHHQSLQNEFFDAFVVTGTERHVLRRGESLWYLAKRKYRVPVWLLRQYNPDLDFASLPAGTAMVVPVVERRSS